MNTYTFSTLSRIPFSISNPTIANAVSMQAASYAVNQVTYCGCDSCDQEVWDTMATDNGGTFSCGGRISWLQSDRGYSENEACAHVASEFPHLYRCDPLSCIETPAPSQPLITPPMKRPTLATSDIIVTLKDNGNNKAINLMNSGINEPIGPIEPANPNDSSKDSIMSETRTLRIETMVETMTTNLIESEKEVQEFLNAKDLSTGRRLQSHKSTKSFFIANMIYIQGADDKLIEDLKKLDSVESVQSDRLDFDYETPTNTSSIPSNEVSTLATAKTWGLAKLGAASLWSQGLDGEGIIVGGIDTGVRGSHFILRDNFRGDYGWFDPYSGTSTPNDDSGHGTHTMGTAVGSDGFGVAPGAKWMACKGCGSTCSHSALLACAEFMLCPTDPQGRNRDCSKAPHVINNSWGGGQGSMWYKPVVDAWRAAGIIPVFSQGNSGLDGCGSANSPGDYSNVIGVGNTRTGDRISSGSSLGPSVNGLMKPDISAPGTDIQSAYINGDRDLATLTGTSMAAPHVTGLIAIMLQKHEDLHMGNVLWYLKNHADQTVNFEGKTCGTQSFPNNRFGYGIIQKNIVDAIPFKQKTPTKRPTTRPSLRPTKKPTTTGGGTGYCNW